MQFIDIHTHHMNLTNQHSKSILNVFAHEIVEKLENLPLKQLISIGLHPYHLESERQQTEIIKNISLVQQYANNNKVWAIGETGLDKSRNDKSPNTNFELQKEVFYQHIKISETVKKPLIIHCVRAYNEVLAIKKQLKPQQKWIFHGFNGNAEIAKQLLTHNCCLSYGYNLFNSTAKATLFFKEMPLELLFLETDTINNSMNNTISDIEKIYLQAAILKNIKIEDLVAQILVNFENLT